VRVWLPAFLEIGENAAKKPKGKPNRETGIDSQNESDVMVIGEYQFGSRRPSATAMERRRGDRRGAPERIVIL
jgi:hypothetical protein